MYIYIYIYNIHIHQYVYHMSNHAASAYRCEMKAKRAKCIDVTLSKLCGGNRSRAGYVSFSRPCCPFCLSCCWHTCGLSCRFATRTRVRDRFGGFVGGAHVAAAV